MSVAEIEFVIENFLTLKTLHINGCMSKFCHPFKLQKNSSTHRSSETRGRQNTF